MLVARHDEALTRLADELRGRTGAGVQVVPADLGTAEGVELVQRATAGTDVGLCVAAAGYGTSGPLLGSPLEGPVPLAPQRPA